MSDKSNCWDNAAAQSFFATLFFEFERYARWGAAATTWHDT